MSVKVTGTKEVVQVLVDLGPREAKNLMRSTVVEIAKHLATDAKDFSPTDEGDLRRGIKHKRARGTKDVLAAEVVANADGKSFHWRFREYGQGPDRREDAMFLKSLQKTNGDLDGLFLEAFTKKLTARMARKAKG